MSEPRSAALSWAAEVAGAPVRPVRRLLGGTHAVTLLLETEGPGPELVLRHYPDADDAPAREAWVLRALDGLDGWAPRVVGVDADRGLILITRLPGAADIMPADPGFAAAELGRALARIHAAPLERLGGLRDGITALAPHVPDAPGAPIVDRSLGRLREAERVLTHFDYWSGNVLWDGPRLTAVVDWSGAALAPRGLDVSWCRLDLVLLHGREVADAFLDAYEKGAGAEVADLARWDVFAVTSSHGRVDTWEPNYTSLGRPDLTGPELRARHARWTENCLAALGEAPS
jgi:aminoglycoside phosphotransferase (APT) family kinase protein